MGCDVNELCPAYDQSGASTAVACKVLRAVSYTHLEIAEHQEISEKYLEAIMKSLVKEGLVTGLRGKGGGYRLSKPPAQYTVGSILKVTEGSLAPVALSLIHISVFQSLPVDGIIIVTSPQELVSMIVTLSLIHIF